MVKKKIKKSKKPKAAAAAAAAAGTILEAMVDGVAVADVNGNYVQVNRPLLKMHGCKSAKEMIGKSIFDFIKKNDVPRIMKTFMKFVRKKERVITNLEFTGLTKQKKEFPVLLNGTVLKDPKGKMVGLLGVLRDITEMKKAVADREKAAAAAAAAQKAKLEESEKYITEMKKAQEEILKSEKKFKDIVTTVPDWVWEVNERGQYVFAGQQIKKILGYKPEEVLGKTPFDLMPKDEAKKIGAIFMKLAAKKEPFFNLRNVNIHKNGRLVVLETSGVPIFDADGKYRGYRGVDRDITEREKAQEQIATAYQYSENLIANMPSSILVFDEELKCSSANWAYYHTFEKESKHIIGNDVTHAVPSGFITEYQLDEKIKEVMKTGKTIELPRCVYHNKHEKIFSVKIVRVAREKAAAAAAAAKQYVMVVIEDVTEKEKASEQIKKARDELAVKVADLEKYTKVSVGRELKMVELKKRIRKLEAQQNKQV